MRATFYGRLATHSYDVGDNPPDIIALYLAAWEARGRPNPVLEPMCGTGLNLIPFLRAGADCDGVDVSPFMLERCRDHLLEAGLTCRLYEQDVVTFQGDRAYRFIFVPGGSFAMIIDHDAVRTCVKHIWNALAPGGWFLFDVRTPHQIDTFGTHEQIVQGFQELPDGSLIFSTGQWQHHEHGTLIRHLVKHEYFPNRTLHSAEVFDYRERLYTQADMQMLLTQAGFHHIEFRKAYDLNQLPAPEEGFVVIAQKDVKQ